MEQLGQVAGDPIAALALLASASIWSSATAISSSSRRLETKDGGIGPSGGSAVLTVPVKSIRTVQWKPWLFGGAGAILGLAGGMILGRSASVAMNEWLQGVGTLVGALTTTVAVVAAVMAYRSDREFQNHQIEESRTSSLDRERARLDVLLQDARKVSVRVNALMARREDGSHHVTTPGATYANDASRPIKNLRWRIRPHIPDWQRFRDYIEPGWTSVEPKRAERIDDPIVLPPGVGFLDNLEFRFELEGRQWASGLSGDPRILEGEGEE